MNTLVTAPPGVEPELIDTAGVAQTLTCSERHVARLTRAGLLPAPIRLGRLVRWPRPVIERWIADGCPPVPRPGR